MFRITMRYMLQLQRLRQSDWLLQLLLAITTQCIN